jgi:hypothetical protein
MEILELGLGNAGRTFFYLHPESGFVEIWPGTFRLALLAKDVGTARAFSEEAGVLRRWYRPGRGRRPRGDHPADRGARRRRDPQLIAGALAVAG